MSRPHCWSGLHRSGTINMEAPHMTEPLNLKLYRNSADAFAPSPRRYQAAFTMLAVPLMFGLGFVAFPHKAHASADVGVRGPRHRAFGCAITQIPVERTAGPAPRRGRQAVVPRQRRAANPLTPQPSHRAGLLTQGGSSNVGRVLLFRPAGVLQKIKRSGGFDCLLFKAPLDQRCSIAAVQISASVRVMCPLGKRRASSYPSRSRSYRYC